MHSDLGQLVFDTTDGFAQSFLHGRSRALRRVSGAPFSPTESHGSSELVGQELDLGLRSLGAPAVAEVLRFFQLLSQLEQSLSVALDRVRIEDRARIATSRIVIPRRDELQDMKLLTRAREQLSENAKSAAVAQTDGANTRSESPIVSLSAKRKPLRRRRATRVFFRGDLSEREEVAVDEPHERVLTELACKGPCITKELLCA
jgi:hypothetical protein